jgi:PAS domain S-box-containing protein
MDDQISAASFEGDPPAAAEAGALSDRKELALVAVERTRMPMVVTDPRQPDNPIVLANQAFLKLTGYTGEEVIGSNCRFLQGPDTDPADIDAIRDGLAANPDHVQVELLNYRKDGSSFWNQLFINAVRDEAGELLYYFASQKDITGQRRAEEMEATERLLLMEVDHRAMNALALVQSIVNLSRADSASGYAASVRGRVQALAHAHRLLGEGGWAGADLGEVLAAEIPNGMKKRVVATGSRISVPAELVQPLALVVHELMSNAIRHGALASAEGTIEIDWSDQSERLLIRWNERGARNIVEPPKVGAGLAMLDGVIERQLGGRVAKTWQPEGLRLEISLPRRP